MLMKRSARSEDKQIITSAGAVCLEGASRASTSGEAQCRAYYVISDHRVPARVLKIDITSYYAPTGVHRLPKDCTKNRHLRAYGPTNFRMIKR